MESSLTESANSTRLEIAQQFLTHLGHRDHARAIELVSPQVTYRVLGHHSLAGTFSGPDEVTNHLVNLVERTMGTFDAFKWEDWMVGEHHVAAIADIHMRADARAFAGRV